MYTFLSFVKTLLLSPITKPVLIAQNIIQQPDKAYPVVDFLKGLSVLMVILFHVFFAVFFLFKKDVDKLNAFIASIPTELSFILAFDKAVDIFFMLSSFLLSYGLLKVYSKKQTIGIRRFYLHRFFRIYPLFLVALLLYGMADLDKLIKDGWYSLLFIENIFSKGIIPVQWSLSIEVQFYLLLPFLVLFLAKSEHPIKWLLVLTGLSVIMRFAFAYQTPEIYQTHWIAALNQPIGKVYMDTMYYVMETRLTPLILGMLWAVILWRYPTKKITVSRLTNLILWAVALTLIYWSLRFPVYHVLSPFYSDFNEVVNLTAITLHRVIFSGAILGLILLSHYQASNSNRNPLTQWKGWRLLSEVAYPMYFFHFPFIAIAWVIVLGTVDPKTITEISLFNIPFVFLLALFLTLYLSLWLNFLVEARFIRIGKQIETKWFGGHNEPQNRLNKSK
ncbi:MAG TPA: acyltransferase [Thiomicrospira sp.]|nr:acyltransferase [Thiomicrospira sp.]